MVSSEKKRIAIALNLSTYETAKKMSDSLGLRLSQFIEMTLNAVGSGSVEDAFNSFFTSLADGANK